MTIEPLPGIIYLKLEKPTAGALDTSSRAAAMEVAEILAVGEGDCQFKVGDKLMVKSWAVDAVTHEDETYYFVNLESGGILAKITE